VRVNVATTQRSGDSGEYVAAVRRRITSERPEERPDNRRDDRRGDGRDDRYRDGRGGGHGSGYDRGYSRGYRHGYHDGYAHGHYYCHNHYYGPHLVFGWHYGGFGFWDGFWHFALVIGSPVLVDYRYYHYHYRWWDSQPTSLVTWDYATQAYPANYTFYAGTCVSLWIRTTDGGDYVVKADPRYWDAADPGELYAELWAQIERDGYLRIEDVNGVVQIFPAGMIQQIEATACR
jgi:hypothetical protein